MNLKNITQEEFVNLFGEEAEELVIGHEFDLFVVNNTTAVEIGLIPEFSSCVVPMIYHGETEVARVMIINLEAACGALPVMKRLDKAFVRKTARGQLVHELTHVRQLMEGRLVNDETGTYWEGVKYDTTPGVNDNYFSTPWEKEAYINQFMHELDCGHKEAEEALCRSIETYKAA